MAPSPLSSVRAQELPSSWPPTASGTGHGGPDPIPAGPAAAPPDTSGRRAPLPRPRSSRSQRRNPNRAAVPHHPGGPQAPWAPAPAPGLGGTLSPRGEVPRERPAARGRQEAHVPGLRGTRAAWAGRKSHTGWPQARPGRPEDPLREGNATAWGQSRREFGGAGLGPKGHAEETAEDTDKSHVDPPKGSRGARGRPPTSTRDGVSRTAHRLHPWEAETQKEERTQLKGATRPWSETHNLWESSPPRDPLPLPRWPLPRPHPRPVPAGSSAHALLPQPPIGGVSIRPSSRAPPHSHTPGAEKDARWHQGQPLGDPARPPVIGKEKVPQLSTMASLSALSPQNSCPPWEWPPWSSTARWRADVDAEIMAVRGGRALTASLYPPPSSASADLTFQNYLYSPGTRMVA